MSRSRALFGFLVLIPSGIHAQQTNPTAGLDRVFQQWNSKSTPGCAVGVSQPGQPVLARAYGMADLEHDVANTPETIFEAGSVSKQFTAASIVLLSLDGKLSLDDNVRKYIPELPEYQWPITIRHLLTHTSGLRDWGSVAGIAGWPRGRRAHTHAHVVDILSRQRALNFPPGAEYSYSNSGYNLLAVIVDRVSGTSFAEFSKKRLFEPLGMTHTQWRDDFTRIVKNRSVGYSQRGGGWANDMPFENVHGNGGLLTTVGDLLIWNENLNTGKLGGKAFLDVMHFRGVLSNGDRISYGAGLMHGEYNGSPEINHTGSTAGYRAFLGRFPEKNISTAVLCNAGNANPGGLGNQIAAIFLGPEPSRPVAQVKAASVDASVISARAGVYRQWRTGDVLRLTFSNGKLMQGNTELIPLSATLFQAGNRQFNFVRGTGTRLRIATTRTDGDSVYYEPAGEFSPTAAQLTEFAGEYYSPDLETTFSVVIDNGRLQLRRRPDTRMILTPVYTDAFNTGIGLVRFHRDANNRINGLSIGQGRVYDLRATRQSR